MDFLHTLMTGIILGSVYALATLGMVIIFKTSRVLNFTQGHLMAIGVFIVYSLYEFMGLPFLLAVIIGLTISASLGFLIERIFIRNFIGLPFLSTIIVTIALGQIIEGIIFFTPFGFSAFSFDEAIPTVQYSLFGIPITFLQILTFSVCVCLIIFLNWFFEKTHLGTCMRAVCDDPIGAQIAGINLPFIYGVAWGLGIFSAGTAGLILALTNGVSFTPIVSLGILTLPIFIVGGIDSFSGSIAAGILIGVGEQLFASVLIEHISSRAINMMLPFLVAIFILLIKPNGLLGSKNIERV